MRASLALTKTGDRLEIPRGSLHAEGEVTDTVTYIVGTQYPGDIFTQFTMREVDDPARTIPRSPDST